MDSDFEIATRAVTPEFVLKVFQDWHRKEHAFYYTLPHIELSFGSTLWEWGGACDLVDDSLRWKEIACEMNEFWKIDAPMTEWKACLTPIRERRLGDICELIARHARIATIRSLRILDRDCQPGGTFLTVKAMLKRAGADVEQIGPSTLLDSYTRDFADVFLTEVSQLAPGVMPVMDIERNDLDLIFAGSGIVLLFAALALMGPFWPLGVVLAAAVIALILGSCMEAAKPPKRVRFGDLKTFKDLAKLLAADSRESTAALTG